jgi:hypothetical protein
VTLALIHATGGRDCPAITRSLRNWNPERSEEHGFGIPCLEDARREVLTMDQLSKRLADV